MRTGGVSGVATKHLARKDAKVHALLGTGVQALTQAWAVAEGANLERCLVTSIDPPEKQQAFAEEVGKLTGVETTVAAGAREAIAQCDILTLATSAKDPIIEGDWLRPGTHINGVGSHAPAMRELDTATVNKSKIVCDLTDACKAEAGDFMIPADAGEWSWDSVHGDLGQVVRGDIPGRQSDDEITLFKSVGLAIQDLSTAYHVFSEAKRLGIGTEYMFR
jgi:ornithine cyclodeaminase/alanine dehydrogenase-like protein (mu-crystallin family)